MPVTMLRSQDWEEIRGIFGLLPYHEAGHAVVAWSLNLHVERVSIEPKRHSLGRCRHYAGGDNYLLKRILVSLAGEAAAKKIDSDRGHLGTKRDRRIACRCALMIANRNKMAARQLLNAKGLEAQALVDRYWGAISDVASELDRRKHLTGRQTVKIIRQPALRF